MHSLTGSLHANPDPLRRFALQHTTEAENWSLVTENWKLRLLLQLLPKSSILKSIEGNFGCSIDGLAKRQESNWIFCNMISMPGILLTVPLLLLFGTILCHSPFQQELFRSIDHQKTQCKARAFSFPAFGDTRISNPFSTFAFEGRCLLSRVREVNCGCQVSC